MDSAEHLQAWLDSLGFEDPEMAGTAERVNELFQSFRVREPPVVAVIPMLGSGRVTLREMPFHSICAHHLLPFFGTASVTYLPNAAIAGLGSIPRTLQHFAQQPQLQERLANQIADHLVQALEPHGLVVRLIARQLCVEMRGPRCAAEVEVTAVRGATEQLA